MNGLNVVLRKLDTPEGTLETGLNLGGGVNQEVKGRPTAL